MPITCETGLAGYVNIDFFGPGRGGKVCPFSTPAPMVELNYSPVTIMRMNPN
jgi:hypothetical protein